MIFNNKKQHDTNDLFMFYSKGFAKGFFGLLILIVWLFMILSLFN